MDILLVAGCSALRDITVIGTSACRLLTGSQKLNYRLNGDFNLGTTHPLPDQTIFTISRQESVVLSDDN